MGMSRSSTLVLAFMMKVMNMTAVDATREVRSVVSDIKLTVKKGSYRN